MRYEVGEAEHTCCYGDAVYSVSDDGKREHVCDVRETADAERIALLLNHDVRVKEQQGDPEPEFEFTD